MQRPLPPREVLHELMDHKGLTTVCVFLVLALAGLTYVTADVQNRQDRVEHTVKLQTIQVQQLLCSHPRSKSCERHAYNVIVSCLHVPKCRGLLVLAQTSPIDKPIVAPTAKEVFGPPLEGGGPQPHQGHQQPGAHAPPPSGHNHHGGHPAPPSPAPTPVPAPAPSPEPSGPPQAGTPGEEPSLKVCAQLPELKKCVEAGLSAVVIE